MEPEFMAVTIKVSTCVVLLYNQWTIKQDSYEEVRATASVRADPNVLAAKVMSQVILITKFFSA